MGMKTIALIILAAATIYSLRDDTDGILACALPDYNCIFPKLLNFALALGIFIVASRFL